MVPIYHYREFIRYRKRFGKRKSKGAFSVLMSVGYNDEGRTLADNAVRTGKPLTHAFLLQHYFDGDAAAFDKARRLYYEPMPSLRTPEDAERKVAFNRYKRHFDDINLRKYNSKRIRHPRRPLLLFVFFNEHYRP